MRTAIRALLAGILAWGVGAAAASTLLLLGISFVRDQLSDRTASPTANSAAPREPAAGSPSPSATVGSPTAAPSATERRFDSPGGTVLVRCSAAGAYIAVADPAPGYRTTARTSGRAADVMVVFASVEDYVQVSAHCESGVPHATISAGEPGDD